MEENLEHNKEEEKQGSDMIQVAEEEEDFSSCILDGRELSKMRNEVAKQEVKADKVRNNWGIPKGFGNREGRDAL